MQKGGGAPPAPDPRVTTAAQTESNIATARKNTELNRINQVTPYGTVSYSQGAAPLDRAKWINDNVARDRAAWEAAHPATQIGGYAYSGGGGDNSPVTWGEGGTSIPAATFNEAEARAKYEAAPTPEVPGQDQWTQTTKLSPEQQRLYDLTTRAQTTYGEIGNNQLDAVKGALSRPDTTDYAQARKDALAAQLARLNPQFMQQEEGLRSRLINQGLTEGSEGWNRAFNQYNQSRNDALIAADLNAGNTVGQQISQTTALRARPLNEVAALLTGQQVQTPQAYAPAAAQVAPTDVLGAYNQQYQGQLAQWNAEQQRSAAGLGGIFGLAGTLGSAAIRALPFAAPALLGSDSALKEDIRRIGTADNGLPLYLFRYKGDPDVRFGLMAQDVQKVRPHAVARMANGFLGVNYEDALA